MVRRAARVLAALAGAVLYAFLAVSVSLALLGWFAPPPVEHQPLDPAEPPAVRAADAVENLRTTDYTYETVVERWDGEAGPVESTYLRVEIDNRARAYYSVVRAPSGPVNRSRSPVRFFSAGLTGYRRVPSGPTWAYAMPYERGRWASKDGLRYSGTRNAFADVERLRAAEAAVLAANDTDLVVRIPNRSVAAAVGHPLDLDHDGDDWTANLTIHVDRRTGVVERGVFRYRDPVRQVRFRTTWRVTAVGRTHVQRPPGTLPPGPLEALYRLDLGVRTLADLASTASPGVAA